MKRELQELYIAFFSFLFFLHCFVVVAEDGGFRGRENRRKWPISWLWKGKQLLPAGNNVILFGVVLYLLITFVCQHKRRSKLTISSLLGWEFDLCGFGFEKKICLPIFYFLICLLNYDLKVHQCNGKLFQYNLKVCQCLVCQWQVYAHVMEMTGHYDWKIHHCNWFGLKCNHVNVQHLCAYVIMKSWTPFLTLHLVIWQLLSHPSKLPVNLYPSLLIICICHESLWNTELKVDLWPWVIVKYWVECALGYESLWNIELNVLLAMSHCEILSWKWTLGHESLWNIELKVDSWPWVTVKYWVESGLLAMSHCEILNWKWTVGHESLWNIELMCHTVVCECVCVSECVCVRVCVCVCVCP